MNNKTIRVMSFEGLPVEIDCKWVSTYLAVSKIRKCYYLYHIPTGMFVCGPLEEDYKKIKRFIIELEKSYNWAFGEFGKNSLTSDEVKLLAQRIIEIKKKCEIK